MDRHIMGMVVYMFSKKLKSSEIQELLRQRISSMPAEALFPVEAKLCEEFGVCRATINKVLKNLDNEGLLLSLQGKGRFVLRRVSRAPTVAVLLDSLESLSHPVMAQRMLGVSEATAESHYHLSVFARNRSLDANNLLEGLHEFLAEAQGVIIATYAFEEKIAFELSSRYPTVWMEHPSDRSKIHGFMSDYLGAGFLAVEHLLEFQHSRIAIVGLNDTVSLCRQHAEGARLAGRRQADGSEQIDIQRWIVEDFSADAGREAILQNWSMTSNPPTGFVFASDELAIGAIEAFASLGVRVPEDVSVIGCNGEKYAIEPGKLLTTVEIDFRSAGRACVETIRCLIENQGFRDAMPNVAAKLVRGHTVARRS
jgi:DNA-binding LacI/PurR family transcriptional regulator